MVSFVYTPVKMVVASRLLKLREDDCPEIWIRTPHDKDRKLGSTYRIPQFLLKGLCMFTQ